MFGNVEKQRRNKEKAPIFRLVLCGGDEGDRTPYLLNAIQALSQVSYTPTRASFKAALIVYQVRRRLSSGLRQKSLPQKPPGGDCGAGSVVTHDLPAGVVAVGSPCRVLRPVNDHDRAYYWKDRPVPPEAWQTPTAID